MFGAGHLYMISFTTIRSDGSETSKMSKAGLLTSFCCGVGHLFLTCFQLWSAVESVDSFKKLALHSFFLAGNRCS
jgi:hypothetical protein